LRKIAKDDLKAGLMSEKDRDRLYKLMDDKLESVK
jgi:hypothetical protein